MKKLSSILLMSFSLLVACNPKDPEANLLIGSWNQTQSKIAPDSAWKTLPSNWHVNVVFNRDGTLSTEKTMPFSGGWCNYAERYSLNKKTIALSYAAPGCIPIFYIPVPSEATILELTSQSLTLDYGGRGLKFERR